MSDPEMLLPNGEPPLAQENKNIANTSTTYEVVNSLIEQLQASGLFNQQNYHFYGQVEGSIFGDHGHVSSQNYPQDRPTRADSSSKATQKAEEINTYEKFVRWFFELGERHVQEPQYQMHILCTAIFEGNTQPFIAAIREYLTKNWLEKFPELSEDEQREAQPVVRRSLTSRQSEIHRETFTVASHMPYQVRSGETRLQTVRFLKPEHRQFALQLLGESVDLTEIRDEIDDILQDLATATDSHLYERNSALHHITRMQAAMTLGILASHDYVHYLNAIILPWASSTTSRPSEMVGWILLTLGKTGEASYQDHVFSLVHHWANSADMNERWTAAHIGRLLGWLDIEATLDILKLTLELSLGTANITLQELLSTTFNHLAVASTVMQTIDLLYFTVEHADAILNALAQWSNPSNHPTLRHYSLIIFVRIIRGKGVGVPTGETKERDAAPAQVEHEMPESGLGQESSAQFLGVWEIIKRAEETKNPKASERQLHSFEDSIIILTQYILTDSNRNLNRMMLRIIEDWLKTGERQPEYAPLIERVLFGLVKNSQIHDTILNLCELVQEFSSIAKSLQVKLRQFAPDNDSWLQPDNEWEQFLASDNNDDDFDLRDLWLQSD